MDELTTAEQFKDLGNALFVAKELLAALEAYTKGLGLEPRNHLLLSNRAMVNSALSDHAAALLDAQACIDSEPTFVKGYFRRASAELQLNLLAEAAVSIAAGAALERLEGKSEFTRLEKMLSARQRGDSEVPPAKAATPTSKDYIFDAGSPIGEGNYTSIVCATHKVTGQIVALKLIQKSEVDRIKKRVSSVL
jgi:serine/threonine-protein phosphatase 5